MKFSLAVAAAGIVALATSTAAAGISDAISLKKHCSGLLDADKSRYVSLCKGKKGDGEEDQCRLAAVMKDASGECKETILKTIGFEED